VSNKTFTLSEPLYRYVLENSLREPEVLRELREETAKLPLARMQIAPEQGQFMALLAKLMGARRCLEVGVFTGYSSLCVALALPGGGRIIACDTSREWTDIARRYWQRAGVADKVELKIGPAVQTLDALIAGDASGTFDFAFIDADKENYPVYFERTLKLLRTGGLAVIDNTLWSGKVADSADHDPDTEAIRAFNSSLSRDSRVFLSLVPIGDGLTLAMNIETNAVPSVR
jgi:predicted O-methyltransferase YrrM